MPDAYTRTAAAAAATPTGIGSLPNTEDHSKLWYAIVLSIELLVLASLFVITRYTVQHRSGLNEPDKIRRIWARAPEIRFQPVQRPLAFAVAVSYGSQTVLSTLVLSLLALVGIQKGLHSATAFVIGLLSAGASSLISILVYRVSGGDNWKLCAASTLGFDWFMSGLLVPLAAGTFDEIAEGSVAFWLMFELAFAVFLTVVQTPFYLWGAYKRLPATARLIYNSSVVPNWVKLDRTILVASPPLVAIYVVAHLCEYGLRCDSYISTATQALAALMMLAASALAAILSVNRALLANEFQWQWRAFLTPAIPLGAAHLLVALFNLVTFRIGFLLALWKGTHYFFSFGGCGALGAYVYLKLAEKYAQSHIDDDLVAQDDLLAEFEEDEDNEELDI